MNEPSVEEIVDEIEAVMDGLPPSQPKAFVGLSDDEKRLVLKLPIARALIASWRELCADRDSWREMAKYWEKIANVAIGTNP